MIRRLALILALLLPASVYAQGPPVNAAPFFGLPIQQGSATNPFTNISFTGQALGGDGSASAPTYSFTSSPNYGFFKAGPTTVDLATGGQRLFAWGNDGNYYLLNANPAIVFGASSDLIIGREAAAVLQMGADAAGVTDQMFKGPDRITSDGVGGNLTIAGGRNRGASAGGSIIFQTSPAAGAGVTGTLTTALTIDSTGLATFGNGTLFAPVITGYVVEANTGTKAATTAESREVYTNTGDGDGSIINLPNDPTVGTQFIVAVVAAQTITINTGAGESIFLAGTSCGTDITGNDTGATLLIIAVTGGSGAQWNAVGSGTWTC